MAFPLVVFLGGAAVGAAAAWLFKDRLDRRTFHGTVSESVDALDRAAGQVVGGAVNLVERVAATASKAAESRPDTPSSSTH